MPSSRRRWTPVLTATLVVAAAGSLSAAPASAAVPSGRCAKVTGGDIARSAAIKVVYRVTKTRDFSGRVYYGCAMPAGKVYEIGRRGRAGDELGANLSFNFVQHAGTFMILRENAIDASGAGTETYGENLLDVKTGRKRELFSESTAEGGECQQPSAIGNPARYVLGANGIAAGVYTPGECGAGGGKTRVVASVPGQPLSVLDTAEPAAISATSLRLTDRTVGWTNAGVVKGKTL